MVCRTAQRNFGAWGEFKFGPYFFKKNVGKWVGGGGSQAYPKEDSNFKKKFPN
jgi:hypothetical protein